MNRVVRLTIIGLLSGHCASATAAPGDGLCFERFAELGAVPLTAECPGIIFAAGWDFGNYYCIGVGGAVGRYCGGYGKNAGPPIDCSAVGNPVNAANGNKYQVERDIQGQGPAPLSFSRYYNSLSGEGALDRTKSPYLPVLGSLWRHSFSRSLRRVQPQSPKNVQPIVVASRADGKEWLFRRNNDGTWAALLSPELSVTLSEVSSGGAQTGWRLVDHSRREVETYYLDGVLSRIEDVSGASLDLVYNANRQLSSVTRSIDGRQLLFGYNGDSQLSTVIAPDGSITTFSYSAAQAFNSDLVQVVRPDATPGNPLDNPRRTYFYDEPLYSAEYNLFHLLTGVQDERNIRTGTYRYDSNRIATGTEQALGANSHQISYSNGVAQVTYPLGAQATMTFASISGSLRMQSTTQPTCAGPMATKSVEFDTRANPIERRDFMGTRTCSTFDAQRNLETIRVEGLATTCPTNLATYAPPAQPGNVTIRKITTSWHPHWHLVTSRAEPKRITRWVYNGQPDPTQGNAIASCAPASATVAGVPIAVLCKHVEQATNDATGGQAFSATLNGQPRTSSYTYNAKGQLLQANGPRTDVSDVTLYEYRATDAPSCASSPTTCPYRRGDLWKVTNALNHVTEHVIYDGAGRLLQTKDANGTLTDLTYHPRGWLLTRTVRGSSDSVTALEYDAAGNVTKVTQPDGSFLRYWYDDASRVRSISDSTTAGSGDQIVFSLDAAGNRIKEETLDAKGTVRRRLARQYNELSQLRALINGPIRNSVCEA